MKEYKFCKVPSYGVFAHHCHFICAPIVFAEIGVSSKSFVICRLVLGGLNASGEIATDASGAISKSMKEYGQCAANAIGVPASKISGERWHT